MYKRYVWCDDEVVKVYLDVANDTLFIHIDLKQPYTKQVCLALHEKLAAIRAASANTGYPAIYTYIHKEETLMNKFVQLFGFEKKNIERDGYTIYAISTEI